METPVVPPPQDARETEIMERLVAVRDQLLLLKQDRTKYIRSQDVMGLYDQTIEEVRKVTEIRAVSNGDAGENRLDRVMESCFQLLSLFFMTIGRTGEAPAAYALTSTIKRLLGHLTEANVFSAKDLESMSKTLVQLSGSVNDADGRHSPYLIKLLSKRVQLCQSSLARLQNKLNILDDALVDVHEKLVSIIRSMALANTKAKFNRAEVEKLKAQLQDIDARRVGGQFKTADGGIAKGSEEVSDLLDRCLLWSDVVLERKGVIPEQWKPIYDVLIGIRNDLDKFSITPAWSLRETDLYDYQRQLDKIDEARVDGNWLDDQGQPAELYVQRTLLYLIRRSYGYIYHLMLLSEPVSEALLPVYNQLSTLKRCLLEVKDSGGVNSARELYPYSMKLNSIDNMRSDGKFEINGDIPEGQGAVTDLLAECFELNYELRVEAESRAESAAGAEAAAET
ncbi:hypothetical protein M406DRAFT_296025 [Cryphonectria parasitica EP155]|uniref:Uncharacterized protein n=1 Tax=Cryphonectria parasitica (strain ATCC 38755 / EP155) TaxID=660469 RepID=A0A9P4XTS9_CRYP1|nr:uncharacterized protein M406DRAFT_296025 [Cryphonectria parasitica EP155]KAF3760645.1 hypothetical protein M406DRAFT_296025 [Cryphonectria parasitica EP155]